MKLRFLLVLLAVFCLSGHTIAQDKKGPARDPKTGRFMKTPVKKDAGKMRKMPARDPKTGRFIKSTDKKSVDKKPADKTMSTGKVKSRGKRSTDKRKTMPKMDSGKTRKMPARDPKTGRFIKSDKK